MKKNEMEKKQHNLIGDVISAHEICYEKEIGRESHRLKHKINPAV